MTIDSIILISTAISATSCCVWNNFIKNNDNIYIDSLTGVNNRHFFQKIEEKEMSGNKYYVVFADIDFFKKVNDTYGHDSGDIVLKEFSRILKQTVKNNSDYVVRWGGEEFVLFLKVSNKDIFTDKVLFKRINDLKDIIEKTTISADSFNIKITASFGLSINTDIDLVSRIKEADKNLYMAKENGRNKVIMK